MNRFYPLILVLALVLNSCTKPSETYDLIAPNGIQKMIFSIENGQPQYSLSSGEKVILGDSKLGLEFKKLGSWNQGFEVTNTELRSFDETWEQVWGQFKEVRNHYNELELNLTQKNTGYQLNLYFRMFDDGLAFRYEIPAQEGVEAFTITKENTEFNFTQDETAWWIPVHSENSYYESIYRETPISQTDTLNTPATFELKNGKVASIHEANLTDYASMTLLHKKGFGLESYLVPWANGDKVYGSAPFETPWRMVLVGDQVGDLAESNTMLNLNAPLAISTDWIHPSKYIGIWWGMHVGKYTWGSGDRHGANNKVVKEYIDFASENGFDGVLVEGWNVGWDGDWTADGRNFDFRKAYPDFDLEMLAQYAKDKGTKIIGHHETAGAAAHYESQLEEAFKLYQDNGIDAVKTGYVGAQLDNKEWHDGQYAVRHYRKVIETAASYGIMIDNHEPVKGTGLERTYPNYMSAEGVRGQEYNAWSADGGNPPSHNTILPFTRILSGPIDFTPGIVDFEYDIPQRASVQSTLSQQLGLYVVFHSPLQMAADLPENYEGHGALEFIKEVPMRWSQTKVLGADIGEYAVFARQDWAAKDWYVGGITNENARDISVDLSFLDPNTNYEMTLYRDTENQSYQEHPERFAKEVRMVSAEDAIEIKLQAGGGFAMKLAKQ